MPKLDTAFVLISVFTNSTIVIKVNKEFKALFSLI